MADGTTNEHPPSNWLRIKTPYDPQKPPIHGHFLQNGEHIRFTWAPSCGIRSQQPPYYFFETHDLSLNTRHTVRVNGTWHNFEEIEIGADYEFSVSAPPLGSTPLIWRYTAPSLPVPRNLQILSIENQTFTFTWDLVTWYGGEYVSSFFHFQFLIYKYILLCYPDQMDIRIGGYHRQASDWQFNYKSIADSRQSAVPREFFSPGQTAECNDQRYSGYSDNANVWPSISHRIDQSHPDPAKSDEKTSGTNSEASRRGQIKKQIIGTLDLFHSDHRYLCSRNRI